MAAKSQRDLLGVNTQCRNIGEATTSEVDVLAVVLLGLCAHVFAQIIMNSGLLVPGSLEVIAEAARGAGPSDLRRKVDSAADCGDVRTGCWEYWVELRCLAVLVQARSSDTGVSGRLKDRHATHAENADQVADTLCVLLGNRLLVVSVGVGDDLGQVVIVLREQELVVRQVWLILVRCTGRFDWIRDVWTRRDGVRSCSCGESSWLLTGFQR